MRTALILSLLFITGPPLAVPSRAAAPAPKEVTSEEQLFAQLRKAESAEDAHPIEEKLIGMFLSLIHI